MDADGALCLCCWCVGQIDYIYVDSRILARWSAYQAATADAAAHCEDNGDGEDCSGAQLQLQHTWPAHDATELHSTRVDTMFSSDHYPLLCDLHFLETA